MFLKLREGILRQIIESGFRKAGNIRKLEKQIKISKSTLSRYHLEKTSVSEENLRKLEEFLGIKVKEKEIIRKFPNNWKQKIGGKKCVESKIKNGNYKKDLENAQKKGALKLKEWHKKMKSEHPEEYYLLQYSKFKRIGGYKYTTERGEKVRNKFEKDVADTLNKLDIDYQYEPLVRIGNRYFFPDFLINEKVILEATAWRGKIKAYKLQEKITELEKKYSVYVVIPKNLYSYYKILNNHLILGLDELSSRSSVW
jgi:transcriptional regulator with XRE-family HTH domain